MSETNTMESRFIGYEYKDITVPQDMASVYIDGYASFGWSMESGSAFPTAQGSKNVNLKFKRDRKIRNKAELIRLQRQFESCAEEILSMERFKIVGASIAAYTVGIIGAAFLAGSVFSYIGGLLVFSIVLAIPGFLCWLIPYFAYRKMKQDKTAKLAPLIDQKYDEIYTTEEKADDLLNQ